MSNGISPEVLAQFQANGWVPPASATAPNVGPAPQPQQPPAPDMLHPAGDIYNSPQMLQMLQPPEQFATLGPRGRNAEGLAMSGQSPGETEDAGGGANLGTGEKAWRGAGA